MPLRDDSVSIRQMLDHAREAVALVGVRSREHLDSDRVLTLALVQLAQIVGEAAGRVSDAKRALHPEIPWSQIIALRNRLVHGYDTIDLAILWEITTRDMPTLISHLEKILP